MFTETLRRPRLRDRVLQSPLINLLTGPHGTGTYTELIDRTWTDREARAAVVEVRRQTQRSVTLRLRPNPLGEQSFSKFQAGQYINLTVEIDGRRRTRCYSPVNPDGSGDIELTIGVHDQDGHEGLVSSYLYRRARIGMTVGISAPAGDFTLGSETGTVLLISGGSGITPVLAMARSLVAQGREVAVLHYARTPEELCYREELKELGALISYTRSGEGDLDGHFRAAHLKAVTGTPDAVYVCGPAALVDAVKTYCPQARSESFVPPVFTAPTQASGGSVAFAESNVTVTDDGRSLLDQAEAAGLTPEAGCRMGICHSCTRRKTRGVVKNLTTGCVSTGDDEDVQICVSVPVGDVEIDL